LEQELEQGVGVAMLRRLLSNQTPIVAILGQKTGWDHSSDPVLEAALRRLGKEGNAWSAIVDAQPLPTNFFEWLQERFERRVPSPSLETVLEIPFSAIFTSSIDPGIGNIVASDGREPELVLLGTSPNQISRSFRRPPIYYLFGRAGAGTAEMQPPNSARALVARRVRHANAMIRNIDETATLLGHIVIDGYDPQTDWLRAEDLLAVLSSSPRGGVLWCGDEPTFSSDDKDVYTDLCESGVVIRDSRPLSHIFDLAKTGEVLANEIWNEPDIVSLADNKVVVTTPRLRLITQASATIIDDSWSTFLPPLTPDAELIAFDDFHGVLGSLRALFDGVRRGFAIERSFEKRLWEKVDRALSQHHTQQGAIVVHGQSGVGKTIALARLAKRARDSGAAVLFAHGRLPQAGDVADFLQSIDQVDGLTLLIADATTTQQRYDNLLRSLRSAGHRAVVIGTAYRIHEDPATDLLIEVPALLDGDEQRNLEHLVHRFAPGAVNDFHALASEEHALARFYRFLPESRRRISEGLGKEARIAEHDLRARGSRSKSAKAIGNMGDALVAAGFSPPSSTTLIDNGSAEVDSAAARIINYVMATSRLYKNVPVTLALRAVSQDQNSYQNGVDTTLILDLFDGHDLFRWRYADDEGSDLLVGARLQIEAQIVCDRRLGSPEVEANTILDLINCAFRVGPEDNEETRFVVEIVQALGPDGPAGDRYKDEYVHIARSLTELRAKTGALNGRLMLQESALRRAYIRTHPDIDPDTKALLLEEATEAVERALGEIEDNGGKSIHASKRTREHLWVERAATYGFLATDSAQRAQQSSEIWASYKAAREASTMAAGRVDSYIPLDIALWMPARILRLSTSLNDLQKLEMQADLRSTLDQIEPSSLDAVQFEMFQRQRLSAGEVLNDSSLSDEAFEELDKLGSTVGYYLRARAIAPLMSDTNETLSDTEFDRAKNAAAYLRQHYSKTSNDPRCLRLLLSMEWLVATRRWLFKGVRQPLPATSEDRLSIRNVLSDLGLSAGDELPPRYRYLEAVMMWLGDNEDGANRIWRQLDYDTKYVESDRVIIRHVLTDSAFQPRVFDGIVVRQIGQDRWSVQVDAIRRRVDLVSSSFRDIDVALGRTVRGFSIGFNYRGPIADRLSARQRSK
jgi:hypothetical protein